MNRVLLIGLLICAAALHAWSQEFTPTIFDRSRGFDRNYVNDIIRDSHGFYWLATDRGILRFDGNNLVEFPDPRARTGNVQRLRIAGDQLYLVYQTDGLAVVNLQTGRYEKLSNRPVADVLPGVNGAWSAFYNDGMLVRHRSGHPIDSARFPADHTAVLHQRFGYVFIKIFQQGIFCIDSTSLQVQKVLDLPTGFPTKFENMDVGIRFSSTAGAYLIKPDLAYTFIDAGNYTNQPDAEDLQYFSSAWQFWIRANRELMIQHRDRLRSYTISGERQFEFRKMLVEDSTTILVAASGGLIAFRDRANRNFGFSDDLVASAPDFRVRRKIIPLSKDEWLLLGNPGFLVRKSNKITLHKPLNQLSLYDAVRVGNYVYSTDETRQIIRYHINNHDIRSIDVGSPQDNTGHYCIRYDSIHQRLIIGSSGAVYEYAINTGVFKKHSGIGSSAVRTMEAGEDGKTWWVGTTDGLYELNESLEAQRFFKAAKKQLQGTSISDLHFTGPYDLWIGHEQGAECMDIRTGKITDRVPTTAFDDLRVTAVLQDRMGRLWFSTFSGIISYDPVRKSIIKLGQSAHLVNSEFNYQSAANLPDGKLIFGGLQGYDVINPEVFPVDQASGIGLIAGYEVRGEGDDIRSSILNVNPGEIVFDAENEYLRIYLSSSNPLGSIGYRYQFRLDDESWKDLGEQAKLEIFKLAPGGYRLEFRAFDENGTVVSFLPVRIQSHRAFFRSPVFLTVLSAALLTLSILVFFLVYRGRIREREIKENISMDLHDEVGTILTKALMANRSGSGRDSAQLVGDYLNEGLHSLRVFINTMNREKLGVSKLVAEIRELLSKLPEAFSAEVHCDSSSMEAGLNSALYRDIKLAVFELVNNCIKHSRASRIEINIRAVKNRIIVELSDDGILSDTKDLEDKGSGVRNLRKRTAKHGGSVVFNISPDGHGLQSILTFSF